MCGGKRGDLDVTGCPGIRTGTRRMEIKEHIELEVVVRNFRRIPSVGSFGFRLSPALIVRTCSVAAMANGAKALLLSCRE